MMVEKYVLVLGRGMGRGKASVCPERMSSLHGWVTIDTEIRMDEG